MKPEIEIYDTTLRDGSQGEGINLSVMDKLRIAERLAGGDDPELFAVGIDHAHFAGANLVVDANELLNRQDLRLHSERH